ncbi:Lrp/AsnC family transcriptional regulator [Phenylobacterium sp.]|uniref:Lrp/AsnC family transcriptional regulator n=1 Tax=Phenylobacterium sp. TaxID=1871053 RepID=UPI0025D7DA7D|nr:Lrp/AsnC family transcriptional regulator [Phenylobacterium sp.]MCA3742276.1 Lrp/AsnC family transcriptional regulator [Phenylobacterium sp.]
MQLDEIDQALLAALRENARESTADLARRVGRSRTTVQGRLERLERRGVIQGYALRLAEDFEAGAVRAHVLIKVAPRESRAVEAAARALPQVRELHSVSGEYDMIVIASAASVAELDAAIDRIGLMPGVERTNSAIILATKLRR